MGWEGTSINCPLAYWSGQFCTIWKAQGYLSKCFHASLIFTLACDFSEPISSFSLCCC